MMHRSSAQQFISSSRLYYSTARTASPSTVSAVV